MATAGIDHRVDIEIPFMGERMAGWLYNSTKFSPTNPGPAIVCAHGLGAVKEMRLDVYADKFNRLGYTVVVFDYRYNGASTVIEYTRNLENVDAERVGLFGTSFSGGHVIQVAAHDARLKTIISQCPFTDGVSSAQTTGVKPLPALVANSLRDTLFGSKEKPVTLPLVGKPGEAAFMNAHDAMTGYEALVSETFQRQHVIPARLVLQMPLLRPGAHAKHVQSPILFALCALDTVAPAKKSRSYAQQAPKGVIKWYDDMGHFDIYVGEKHERAMKDYVEFLQTNLPA